MDRTRAQFLIVLALGALAVAGNTLRAIGPEAAADLRLAGIMTPVAGPYSEQALDADFLETLRAREVLYRIFTAEDGEPLWLFLGYFDRQKEGSQVHSPRHCYPGSGWNIESEHVREAPWGGESTGALVVSDGVERRLVLYWYQTPAGIESDVLPLKLEMTRCALLRRPQEVVFVSISTPAGTDVSEAMVHLAPLANAVHEEINRLYGERDERRTRI